MACVVAAVITEVIGIATSMSTTSKQLLTAAGRPTSWQSPATRTVNPRIFCIPAASGAEDSKGPNGTVNTIESRERAESHSSLSVSSLHENLAAASLSGFHSFHSEQSWSTSVFSIRRAGPRASLFAKFQLPNSILRRCASCSATSQCSEPVPSGLTKADEKCVLRNLSYEELEAWVEVIGFRKRQALMLWTYLYADRKWAMTVDELAGLSNNFRAALHKTAQLSVLKLREVHAAADGTRKILFTVDGGTIETVAIPNASGRGRLTVCVSSQIGCAMNCQFCFTGRMGLKRNLSTAEIMEQLVVACRLFSDELGLITNVVFMGMGEPLHNANNVIRAANIMIDDHGFHLSHNKVTISTCGLVPQIQQFYQQTTCCLAVSLNATNDETRNWIMPINRKYNLSHLMNTLREVSSTSGRPVFFEYVMLAGVNDSVEDAHRLVNLVRGTPCKINLICFNGHSESAFQPSPEERMLLFREIINRAGLTVYIRRSRGDDQMAACGQLGSLGEQKAPRMSVPKQFEAILVGDPT